MRLTWTLGLVALFAIGCGGELPPEETDADLDGYFADSDCDDADAAVNPGTAELCDGLDQNCDGERDEGFERWDVWEDKDGDLGGAKGTSSIKVCRDVENEAWFPCMAGLSPNDGDCDDSDPITYNRAEEIQDGKDNNCDGVVDEPADPNHAVAGECQSST